MHHYVTESGSTGFDYGCASPQSCTHSFSTIFGRRSEGRHVKCTVCCDDSRLCNQDLSCNSTVELPLVLPRECSDLKLPAGRSGVYTIYPYGKVQPAVSVFCEVDESVHSWTVIQRRFNGSVSFYRDWQTYKNGFGSPFGEYWLGNDVIHELTSDANHALMIKMTDMGDVSKFAEYLSFHVSSEDNQYSMMVSKYDGTAGDSFSDLNGQGFTTYDRDNDLSSNNCAVEYKGAWWYGNCHASNLNGLYLSGHHDEYATGINWYAWHGYYYSLKTTEMMIRKY